jgi:hypothetical protein
MSNYQSIRFFLSITFISLPTLAAANNGLGAVGKAMTFLMISAIGIILSLFFLAYSFNKRFTKQKRSFSTLLSFSFASLIVVFLNALFTILGNHHIHLFHNKMIHPGKYPEIKLVWFLLFVTLLIVFFLIRVIRKDLNERRV